MTDVISLTEPQLQSILSAISASQRSWWPVASVFVSALLGMVVGLGMEQYKTYRVNKTAAADRQKTEISKINVAIVGLGYNLETLHTIASQYLIPHHEQSHSFYQEIQRNRNDDKALAQMAAMSSSKSYPALATICPDIFLLEHDFVTELPFLVEKDADLVKDSSWLISQSRELAAAIKMHNDIIMTAWMAATQMNGLPFAYLQSIAHRQMSISQSECLISSQLMDLTLSVIKKLETVNSSYKIRAKKSSLPPLERLEATMVRLRQISNREHNSTAA